jgi:hypothetical protein
MSKKLVVLSCKPSFTLGPVRAEDHAPEEFNSFGKKIKVTLRGTLIAADVKKGEEYAPAAFGLLPVYAGKAKSKKGEDYLVGVVGGGLSFFLMKTKKADSDVLYTGTLEKGDGQEYPIFARERKGKTGNFLSINAGEARAKEDARNRAASGSEKGKVPAGAAASFEDDDIPF